MKIHELPKLNTKSKKRVGRGYGSGKGKTSGKGEKGQSKREKIKANFEGGQLPLIKRLPRKRGVGAKKPRKGGEIINLNNLKNLKKGAEVTLDFLIKEGIIKEKRSPVKIKILSFGNLKVPLVVGLPQSLKAKEKILKSGGKVI
ncbi:MAG: 50S ribosomal protein L15 [Candidatus Woykebacteria bacterium RBG_13_40_7b]|uniref:Large ribosomal subunit protein uL15 n=1 Tax=Candidatus Woykebacteria bacterium RBG_13_40_7b TaxID=1802594 RepID=A0A1G1W7X8_9BACT|nr:MAG: 50S ribosomal protein L15 [Candidatus Woykebacteria bacterium RBG_13_40_7b]